MRDYALGTTFDIKFTTRKFSTGAPFTLAGTPVISAYPDNSTTEITAGITLSVDFDSVTGLHNIRVVASGGNGYAAGSNYALVVTTGTVDGVSVVGEVVGEFSIEAQSALRPTTAGRTLDVSAGGEAGLDWANIGSPTTAQTLSGTSTKALEPTTAGRTLDVTATGEAGIDWANIGGPTTAQDLSGTTIKTTQKVDVDTIKTNPVVNGGTVTFPTNSTLASTTNITAGTVTTATNVTTVNGLANNVITAAAINADAITAAKIADGAIDAATFAAGAINAAAIAADAITDAKVAADVTIASVTGAVGSVTGNVGGNVTGSVGSVAAGGIAAASFAANAITAAKLDPDVTTELQAGLATAAAVDDLPTNAELATALAAADDAVLAQVALVKAKTDLIPGTTDGKTFAQLVTLWSAVLLGKASGLGTTTAVYRAIDDSKDRVTATVDADGNRTAVTLDAA